VEAGGAAQKTRMSCHECTFVEESSVKFFNNQAPRAGKTVIQILVAAALSIGSFAQAGTLNFEGQPKSPFVLAGQHIKIGDYWIEAYGGELPGDMVGAFVKGSEPETCMTGNCPVNNPTQYYTGLDNGYFYFGRNDDTAFRLDGLNASFVGAGQDSFPDQAGMLVLRGFDANGKRIGPDAKLALAGPNDGQFSFEHFNLGKLTDYYSFVLVFGLECDAAGKCSQTGQANFAIDDISTIPEPGSLALFGLGLAGLGLAARRRRVR